MIRAYIARRVFHTQFHTPTYQRSFPSNPNKTRRVHLYLSTGSTCYHRELLTKGGIKRLISEEILVREWAENCSAYVLQYIHYTICLFQFYVYSLEITIQYFINFPKQIIIKRIG